MTPALRVLTWHVHGSYLQYLAACGHAFLVPVRPGDSPGYAGRAGNADWPSNIVEVPAGEVAALDLDVVLYQSQRNWTVDRFDILSDRQRTAVPQVYVEHDPPREHPTDTRHPAAGSEALIVHVTPFNALMWDAGPTPATVVDHGVPDRGHRWTGELGRGLVVVNDLAARGRRLGLDVFERVRASVPLDLVGMGSEALGGLGEVPLRELPEFAARYRFLFNPIRYTSLGLAVCEAMMLGMPIVGLATTEMATAVTNGVSGYVDTDVSRLVTAMQRLIDDHDEAARLGAGARRAARERFSLERFARDWDTLLRGVAAPASRRGAA